MTDEMMTLRALLEKSSDAELLPEMIGFTAQRLMELEVEGQTGAGYGEKNPERLAQRNGYRSGPATGSDGLEPDKSSIQDDSARFRSTQGLWQSPGRTVRSGNRAS